MAQAEGPAESIPTCGGRWIPDRARNCFLLLLLLLAGLNVDGLGATPVTPQAPSPEIPLDQLIVRQWTTDHGLPSNALNRVLAVPDGYLWISTFSGLVRFDGRSFGVIGPRETPGLGTNGFVGLHHDEDGQLWVGTQGDGPWRIDDDGLRPRDPEGRQATEVVCLWQDRQGDLWVGFENQAMARYRGAEPMVVEDPTLNDVRVRDIVQAKDGSMWFATQGKGVVRLRDGDFLAHQPSQGMPGASATSLAESADGAMWVGLAQGLARIADGEVTTFPQLDGVAVADLLFDPLGSLWLATSKGLMRRRQGGSTFEVLRSGAGLPFDTLRSLSLDSEGNLWLATGSRGLFQIRQGKFFNLSAEHGLPETRSNSVFDEANGDLLIGTDLGAFRLDADDRVWPMDLGPQLIDAKVMDFFRDRQRRLWVSTYGGLLLVDGERRRVLTVEDGLPDLQVRWVRQDLRGRIWIGTIQGIVRWQDGGIVEARELGPQHSEFAFSFAEFSDGRLLFGFRSGLLLLDTDDRRTVYRSGHEFPSSLVFSTYVDATDTAWITSPTGLLRLRRDGGFDVYNRQRGLPADAVYDVLEDASGFLWMSSVHGAIRVARQDLEDLWQGRSDTVAGRTFDEQDGMLDAECTGARKMSRGRDGRLWFPTLSGVAGVAADRLPTNPVPPPVRITAMRVDGKPVTPTEDLRVAPGSRRLAFDIAALSFTAPDRVEMKYRLDGFDSAWNLAEGERTVSYTNLPHGSYRLRVIAANGDGLWNEEGTSLSFTVPRTFYQSIWFLLLLLSVSTLAIVAIHRWRVRAVSRRNQLLEKDAIERSRLIEQLASKNRELELFAYTASHDLKSPLVTIEGFLGLLEKDALAGDIDRMEGDLRRIRGGIQTMQQLLEGLLEVSRIGRQDDTPTEVALSALARQAAEALTSQIEAAGAVVEIDPDLPKVLGSPSRLIQVFQNLIANAVKFRGEAPPRIVIGYRDETRRRVIFVRDNGLGIDPRHHDKVFGLFDRLDPQKEGSGLGLAIVQRVIEVHGGEVWVESEGQGKGSTFCFSFGNDCYQETEP